MSSFWCGVFPGGSDKNERSLAVALVLVFVHSSPCLRVLPGPPPSCSQQGLKCMVNITNCMDDKWLVRHNYTPSAPEELEVGWETRGDEGGMFPVLNARWKIKDDGSISFLKGTELHVLLRSDNQHLCVRYSFSQSLPMRNPSEEKWSFSVAMVVVEPGQTYLVSVFNLPKPELSHTGYTVSKEITVPDCPDSRMKTSRFCIESGSLWQPNITLAPLDGWWGTSVLFVSFNTDEMAERYRVLVQCHTDRHRKDAFNKNNLTSLNVSFDISDRREDCCSVDVEIQPFFSQCDNDCVRRRKTFPMCNKSIAALEESTDALRIATYLSISIGLVFLCLTIAYTIHVVSRPTKGPSIVSSQPVTGKVLRWDPAAQPPKLLVIYSQDHRLYRDVVLKLCAFLTSKCGTDVLVDLLDTTIVGTVGPVRWLEWQRRQLKNPMDKILVLCSPGVQAKWKAMCGQERVLLREDVLSPTDDMLVPFLNLFLPDMHQPATLGKYIVAYFEDIGDERDVPSVFDIAVKYRLMKHLEELYFRILEIQKYQPGCVNHIEGIGREDYFNCPSGKALKDAIETFKAFQLENPDWFESECVASEEELAARNDTVKDLLEIPPVLECVPLIREGSPFFVSDVELNQNGNAVCVLTPELSRECESTPVMEVQPRINPLFRDLYQLNSLVVNTPVGFTAHRRPHDRGPQPVLTAGPALREPLQMFQRGFYLQGEVAGRCPTEHDGEDAPLVSSAGNDQRLEAPRRHRGSVHDGRLPRPELRGSQPVEATEEELLWAPDKGPGSGSDQGYVSKGSSQPGSPVANTDPLIALARLQEELFQKALASTDDTHMDTYAPEVS